MANKYLTASVLLLMTLSAALTKGDPIKIDSGLISGTTISEEIVGKDIEVCVYRGIPYGASTAGNNRWRPPGKSLNFSKRKNGYEMLSPLFESLIHNNMSLIADEPGDDTAMVNSSPCTWLPPSMERR